MPLQLSPLNPLYLTDDILLTSHKRRMQFSIRLQNRRRYWPNDLLDRFNFLMFLFERCCKSTLISWQLAWTTASCPAQSCCLRSRNSWASAANSQPLWTNWSTDPAVTREALETISQRPTRTLTQPTRRRTLFKKLQSLTSGKVCFT